MASTALAGGRYADLVAGEVQRVHGVDAQPAVPLERQRGGQPGERRVAAAGQAQVLDAAPGQPARPARGTWPPASARTAAMTSGIMAISRRMTSMS